MKQLLFHPSSLGQLMTNSRSKSDPLGETCKSKLLEIWVEEKFNRKKTIANKWIEKGLLVEEDSLTLYSRCTKKFFKKNKEQISNDWFTGTPDIIEKDCIIDIKSSWDLHTFLKANFDDVNKNYFWQGQAYMDLTGIKKFKLVYCLINTPEQIINDEKRKLGWLMGTATDTDQKCIDAFSELEKEMIFDDIPMGERFFEIEIDYNEEMMAKAKEKLVLCREYIKSLKFQNKIINDAIE
ncbi:hypothetical protein KGQ29_03860 [Patescibacteria group bacterium]|nr:hypothetical protein [Patescibacteria group bacterium]